MQEIIEGMARELKRAVSVYNDRKIVFTDKKNVLKTSLLDLETNEIVCFDMPYKGIFNQGLINVYLVEPEQFKEYESKTINDFIFQLKVSGGVSTNTNIFVTLSHNYIIQHELQHVFDNLICLKTPIWEHEYRAFLASLIYCENPNNILLLLSNYVRPTLKEVGFDFFKNHLNRIIEEDKEINIVEPHEVAILKLIIDLDNIQKSEEQIRNTSKKLLDDNYKKNFGATYSDILGALEEELEGY